MQAHLLSHSRMGKSDVVRFHLRYEESAKRKYSWRLSHRYTTINNVNEEMRHRQQLYIFTKTSSVLLSRILPIAKAAPPTRQSRLGSVKDQQVGKTNSFVAF